jgi:hypothetical protein
MNYYRFTKVTFAMYRNSLFALLVIGFTLIPPEAIGGEIYKWVDAQGQTHFSSQKPTGVDDFQVLDIVDSTSTPSQASEHSQELARIKEFTRQLTEEREARERQRLEDRLDALEASYQELLEQKSQSEEQGEIIWGYATPPYYYPYPDYSHPHPVPGKNPRLSPPFKHPHEGGFDSHHDLEKPEDNSPRPPFRPFPPPPQKLIKPREMGAPSVQGTILSPTPYR